MTDFDEPTPDEIVTPVVEAPAAEPAQALEPAPDGPSARRRVEAIAPLLALATAVLLASNIVFAVLWMRASAHDREQKGVQAVATRFVHNLVTFNYKTIDADIARIRRDATGNFKGQLATAFGGRFADFRGSLVEAEAESTGVVHGVVLKSVARGEATVLAFADQTIKNKSAPEPRTVARRVRLTLVKTVSGWKVDSVDTEEQ